MPTSENTVYRFPRNKTGGNMFPKKVLLEKSRFLFIALMILLFLLFTAKDQFRNSRFFHWWLESILQKKNIRVYSKKWLMVPLPIEMISLRKFRERNVPPILLMDLDFDYFLAILHFLLNWRHQYKSNSAFLKRIW